jgi:uncharacterized protein YbjT (DUF2867 family)
MLLGASGNVGSCVAELLIRNPMCQRLLVVTRRKAGAFSHPKVSELVVNMDRLEEELAPHAAGMDMALVAFGVGKGTAKLSEEELRKIEVGYPLAFCRAATAGGARIGAVMTAVGADPGSKVRYVRIIGEKERAVQTVGFDFLSIYRPAVILGNTNTPNYLGRLMPWVHWAMPKRYHSIHRTEIAQAMVAQSEQACLALERGDESAGKLKILEYSDMKRFVREG